MLLTDGPRRAIAAFVVACSCPMQVSAEITKEVAIDSSPPGAHVYLLQGSKRTLLGVTPARPQLEFHSEMSVLRLSIAKAGFQSEAAEVTAGQASLLVVLRRKSVAADPRELNGQAREIQRRIFQALEEGFGAIAASGAGEIELADYVRTVQLDGKSFLLVPVRLSEHQHAAAAMSARAVWDLFPAKWLQGLAQILRGEAALQGVVLDVRLGALGQHFSVGSELRSRTELQCVPGTEYIRVYEPCIRQVEKSEWSSSGRESRRMVCEGGLVSRPVFNSCLTRVPVTRTEAVASPRASTAVEQSRIQYVIPAHRLMDSPTPELYPQISFLRSDAKGNIVERHGALPGSLPLR